MSSAAEAATAEVARPWAVYLLHCAGNRSYVGISPAPHERFAAHQSGKGAAFTRANRPLLLAAIVWFERFASTTAAAPASLDAGLASLEG